MSDLSSTHTNPNPRAILSQKLLFVRFFVTLDFELFVNKELSDLMNSIEEELKKPPTFKTDIFLIEANKLMDHNVGEIKRRYGIARNWNDVMVEILNLFEEKSYSAKHGIQLQYIVNLFDVSKIGVPSDMPLHAQIGVGPHAEQSDIEEHTMLRDATFYLVKMRQAYQLLNDAVSYIQEVHSLTYDQLRSQTNYSFNVCTYARTAMILSYSFIECFVNSLGQDAIIRDDTLSGLNKEILTGKKDGRYLTLEYKIEKYPGIIRHDQNCDLRILDSKQRKEPFSSFFKNIKEIRDSLAHPGMAKANIWRSPKDWVDVVESTLPLSIEVAKTFWGACYPHKGGPIYLHGLDIRAFEFLASARLRIENGDFSLREPDPRINGAGLSSSSHGNDT